MARRKLTEPSVLEPRGSKDPRVQFVPVPNACPLVVVTDLTAVPGIAFKGAIVWVKPPRDVNDAQLVGLAETIAAFGASRVVVLPRGDEDADLPAVAGSPASESHVSEVRPVVVELIAELPEELRDDVAAFVECELSEAGL